ncbi:MAG: type III pantothenate kinase [Chloroflexota bacterium]|jgi:type III pantothenate kinase
MLAVDIGNSAAKAALVEGGTVLGSGRLDTSVATAKDLLDGLRVLAGAEEAPPAGVIAVSVVDRWTERLERAAETLALPLTVVAASHIPISTALVRPDQTGPDRLLAAWAASRLYGSPVIVVDLGTATTVDAVDADGFFLGGAILPGLGLAADALAEGTARLPRVELELPAEAIGHDTHSAIASGIVIGHIGAVRELALRMHEHIGADDRTTPTRIVVTGGHAAAPWAQAAWRRPAAPGLPSIADELDPDLVLRGLGLLAEHIRARVSAGAQP